MQPLELQQLASRFDQPGVLALVLMGSYARGDAGPFSDVDLVRFIGEAGRDGAGSGSHLIDGRLVVVSDVDGQQVEAWFTQPEIAVNVIAGMRSARPLIDHYSAFAAIQARAHAFVWDEAMQARADRWVSQQMVGWMEEVHKALEGLRRNDVGRLLNARFGLSWGLLRIMAVHHGLLSTGDNGLWTEVGEAVGADSEWTRLRNVAFGITGATLREQVVAGLRCYRETAGLIQASLHSRDWRLITATVVRITDVLT